MPLTFDDVQAKKTRRTITHAVVTDDDAVHAYRLAKAELEDARRQRLPQKELTAHVRAVQLAESVVRSSTLLFRLQALPPDEYGTLKAEHPPREADNAAYQALTGRTDGGAEFHVDTFGPAVVAACLIEPRVTLEQVLAWKRQWNDAEWADLVSSAILVNQAKTPTAGLIFS